MTILLIVGWFFYAIKPSSDFKILLNLFFDVTKQIAMRLSIISFINHH